MYRLILLAVIFISIVSCGQRHGQTQKFPQSSAVKPDSIPGDKKNQAAADFSQKNIEYYIIKVPNGLFGYYIMVDGSMYIEQKTIPAIEGNVGFKTKEDAEKIAKLVIQKIREGEIPPTITVDDLIAHHVIDP